MICPTCHRALFRNSMTVDEAAKSCPNTDAPGCLRYAYNRLRDGMIRAVQWAGLGVLPGSSGTISCERILEIGAEFEVNP
jgi:hypothetical protein